MERAIEYNPAKPFSEGTGLYELENNPDVLIRTEPWEDVLYNLEVQDKNEAVFFITDNFNDLKTAGMSLPDPRIFSGSRNGIDRFQLVVDKIKGPNLQDLFLNKTADPNLWNGLMDEFFSSLIRYIALRINSDKPYLCDLFNEKQFVYGRSKNDSSGKVYLVDLDLYFYKPQSRNDSNLKSTLESLLRFILRIENKVGKLETARQEFSFLQESLLSQK